MNIFENCPELENERFLLRPVRPEDRDDLLKVYSDKNALPFFNSDNCDGDIFWYATAERMAEAMRFWDFAYENGWFVRFSVLEKQAGAVIGTAEVCVRASGDAFDRAGILRVDVGSGSERADVLYGIFSLITPRMRELTGCEGVITKVPGYAVERLEAVRKAGFVRSPHLLVGKDGTLYGDYWTYAQV